MENLGKFVLGLFIIFLSFCIGLLVAKVILSIAVLYGLAFIVQFSFVQVYGLLISIGLLKYKYKAAKPKKEPDSSSEALGKAFIAVVSATCTILLIWGVAFMMHWILV